MATPAFAQLRVDLRGDLIEPGSSEYEQARKVHNGMIDRRPRLIARCVDAADVIAAVKYARAANLRVAIRGGGHSASGLGVCDDGLVIDLSRLRYVHVDPSARTVRVGGGSVWGDVDHATHQFGLAVPAGVISTTGVAGLTLGGGTGYLTRKYGLTIDNLLSADVVLADGSFVTAAPDRNSDLFWALRGGGGNFGVVTSFLFQARPVDTVSAGPVLWEMDRAADVLRFARDFLPNAPEDFYGFFAFLTVPPGPPFPATLHLKKMCALMLCHLGTPEQANKDLEPVRHKMKPVFEHFGPVPFPALQSLFDPLYPAGLQGYWKGDMLNEISDASIPVHVKYGAELPTPLSTMHLYPINGAAARVGRNDTAWSYRDATWNSVIVGFDPDPANRDKITNWTRAYYDALHPYSAGGAYVNFMMEEGQDRVRAAYRDNYDRLARIKAKYDPDNLFRLNQNIRPA
jgi:FAD/FMN-containing dehydrogenase